MPYVPFRYRRKQSIRSAIVCFAVIATTVVGQSDTLADNASGALPSELVTDKGSFRLSLESLPAPIPLNELFEIRVSIDSSTAHDDSSNPVWLGANAEMPAHKHGMNSRIIVEQLDDGRFELKGLLFHMRGEWLITFDVAMGRVHEQAKIRVSL